MAWGGSLNKEGSDYIRKLKEAEKVIEFLEGLKEDLNLEEQAALSKTIEIILDFITKLSERKD